MQPVIPPSRVAQLKAATSPATMLERLARDCEYSRRRGLRLVDCQAVRVYPRDGDRFVLEYEMRFLGADGERVERVFGEVVGEGVEDCYREVIESLRKTRRKQLSPDRATDLITCLPDLGLVLRFAGLDERLHGLKLIFKLPAVAPILSRYAAPGGKVTGVAAEVLGHRLGKRCTIRFRFQSPDPNSGLSAPHSVIAKLYNVRSDKGGQVAVAMQELWDRGFSDGSDIRIPKPLAYVPDWQMLLMKDVSAIPLHDLEGAGLLGGVTSAGRALARLHSCALEVAGRYTVDDEVGLLEGWVAIVSQVYPEMMGAFEDALRNVRRALDRCRHFQPTLVHRDFYEKQVLLDGTGVVLIDFDTVCISDPALDVGNFLAHLRLAGLKRQVSVERLEEAFLVGYSSGVSQDLGDRVEAYTKSSLLRLACLNSLVPASEHLAEPLLRDV